MTNIEKNIIRRVKIIFAIRRAFQPLFVEIYVMVLALSGIFFTSSVFNVFENMSLSNRGVGDILHFSYSAFVNTEILVQAFTVLVLVSAVFLLKDLGGKLVSREA